MISRANELERLSGAVSPDERTLAELIVEWRRIARIGGVCERLGLLRGDDGLPTIAENAEPIRIGNNVWIGCGVTVIGGVTIGNDVVIGAGSVVLHDIPDGVLAAGNPCRVIRKITEKDSLRHLVAED